MKVTTDACLFGAWCAQKLSTTETNGQHILDAGAGSGLLSLMVAQKTNLRIDAVEIDAAAAGQAQDNVRASPWKENIRVIAADLLHWKPAKKYDAVIANPPFYQNEWKSSQRAKNVAHHDEGLTLRSLLQLLDACMTETGNAYLLLPAKRETEILHLLGLFGFRLRHLVRVKQTLTHAPFRLMLQIDRSGGQTATEELAVKDENDRYTAAFSALLKNYYLYL